MSEDKSKRRFAPVRRVRGTNDWLVAGLLVTVAVLMFQMKDALTDRLNESSSFPRIVTQRGELLEDERVTIRLAERASQSVVQITNISTPRDEIHKNALEIPQGTGSGIVWNADGGYIVTNYHVIRHAQLVRVTLSNYYESYATVVGVEPDKDLAVLKLDEKKFRLRPIDIGRSDDLKVGQKVYAIGNPFGLDQTLTTGVISGLGREIRSVSGHTISDVIQTDAAIFPGSSGGPLLDSEGRVIGVNTAIYSPSGIHAGIGFAIPINTVNRIVPQLIAYGTVGGIGVRIFPDEIVSELLKNGEIPEGGVLVRNVIAGSAAEQAGILASSRDEEGRFILGDLIVSVNEQDVTEANDLVQIMEGREVGDPIRLRIRRKGETIRLRLTLQPLPIPTETKESPGES